jgi:spermidine/putrescine transport system permease protein
MSVERADSGRRWSHIAAAPGMAWLAVFVLLPTAVLVAVSFWESDIYGLHPSWTLHHWRRIFETPLYIELLWKTLRIAAGSTFLTLAIAYPVAFFLTQLRGRWKSAVVLALFIPFWVGFVVRTFAWLPVLGRNGFINQALSALNLIDSPIDWLIYNEGAVYVGLVNGYLIFMILPIYLSLDRIDRSVREAAADLYAAPWATFRHVLLPLSLPGIASGCIMVFLLDFGAYVTPALLGGPSGIMFSNVIAQQFTADNDWAFGSALSLLMTAIVLGILFAAGRMIGLQRIFLNARGA